MKNLRKLLKNSMKNEPPKEIVEAAEEVVVEVIKAPFKIASKLWDWITEIENV